MFPEINTEKFGTTGLPKFGAGYTHGQGATGGTQQVAGIGEVDAAFNGLIAAVKKNCLPGNTALLWYLCNCIQPSHRKASHQCVKLKAQNVPRKKGRKKLPGRKQKVNSKRAGETRLFYFSINGSAAS